jgi:hypothetical protein
MIASYWDITYLLGEKRNKEIASSSYEDNSSTFYETINDFYSTSRNQNQSFDIGSFPEKQKKLDSDGIFQLKFITFLAAFNLHIPFFSFGSERGRRISL